MRADKIKLLEFLGSTKRTFNIPVYQRNYDWKLEQCERLFKDIETIVDNNYEYEHFLGTVVYVSGNNKPNFMEFIIIDGQQRITSLMLLLIALYNAIEDEELKEDIYCTYLINERSEEKYRIKLKPVKSDMSVYEKILEGSKIENSSNMYNNYIKFEKMIKNSIYSPKQLYEALNYVEFVYIHLENSKKSENPQLIFETLNSTGLSLLESDLIRNFLLMNHDYKEQEKLYTKYWLEIEKKVPNSSLNDFIRSYLILETEKTVNENKIYETFKNNFKFNKKISDEEILNELLKYINYYSYFLNKDSKNSQINRYLSQIERIKITVLYPLLLFLFETCYEVKKISEEELIKIIDVIVCYSFRREICGLPSNSHSTVFLSLLKKLKNLKAEDYYLIVAEHLLSQNLSKIFPRDELFKNSFISRDIYSSKSKLLKEIFLEIEKYLSKEVIDVSEIQIEHIMPQKLTPSWEKDLGGKYKEIHDKYVNVAGNLTLTGYNSEMSNKPFNIKKQRYRDSNIKITRELAEIEFWNEDEIKKRSLELFEIVKKIWKLPNEDKILEKIEKNILGKKLNIMEEINVTGHKPKLLIIDNENFSLKTWKIFLEKLSIFLYNLDMELFSSFRFDNDFLGREKRIISNNDTEMRTPIKIADDLYLETNLSANVILSYSKILCEKFKIEDVVFYEIQ